eukprot:198461_1
MPKRNQKRNQKRAKNTQNKSKNGDLKQQGNAAFINKNYLKAVQFYTKAIASEKGDHTLYSNRSAAYKALNDYPQAINDADICIELKPNWHKGYIRKLNVLFEQNKICEAVSVYKHALDVCVEVASLKQAMNDNIVMLLNVDEKYKNQSMFSEKNADNQNARISRIRFILQVYSKWVRFNTNSPNVFGMNVYDIINHTISPNYTVNQFLNDYLFFVTENRNISFDDDSKDDTSICDVQSCYIMNRNERKRQFYVKNNHKRNELFFTGDQHAEDELIHSISIQQILDTLHCFMFHTLRINNIQKYNRVDDMNTNDDEINYSCNDKYTAKLMKLIENRTKKSRRYTSINSRDSSTNSKFYTIIEPQPTSIASVGAEEKINGTNISEKTFTDHFIDTLKRNKIDDTLIVTFTNYIVTNDYDTESLREDLQREFASNVAHDLSSIFFTKCQYILSKHVVNTLVYSPGYRFFYWNFYKNNQDKIHCIYKTGIGYVNEENTGYKLCDWYIERKYSNFKTELLTNATAPFSLEQYNTIQNMARMKLEAWKTYKKHRKLICLYNCGIMNHWQQLYGIKQGDVVAIYHIMALLFYTNYTENSFEFSRSFRKVFDFETDEQLKERHGEFFWWGKNIRECIECFGEMMENTKRQRFYHGINLPMIFDSTAIKLNGPLSTTADYMVAIGIFGSDGIVIDIQRTESGTMFFDCNPWSDFTNEDERFFIGGLILFNFVTIRDIKNTLNYEKYIKP